MASNPPPLVDLQGRPLQREVLAQEIARPVLGSVRTIQSGHPAQGLTPTRLASLLLSAEQGDAIAYFELAEEMEEKDLHYLSVLGTRKRAVAQLPIEVEPADDSEQAKADAKLVQDWLERDMLEAELFDILDAVGKGVSATEIVWNFSASAWLPRAIKWRDPRWFEFDREDGETLRLRGNAGPEDLPAAKFIVHFHPAKSGLPIRSGLARIAAWAYMFKNFAIKDWVIFLEAYGHPVRIGKYGPNESEENKRILERALRQLGTDAAAAFPETMSVEFVDRKAGTAPNDLWRSHAEYFDMQLSKAVLGQTNTTDAQAGGLGSGQAQVHNEVREDIERADAKLLAATLNRDLVVPLVMLNRGQRERYPRIRIGRPDPVDVSALLDASERLADRGVEIDADEVRERAGVPAAKPGGTVLGKAGAAPAVEPGDGNADGADPAPADGTDAGVTDQIQKLALNGAQVTALADMVAKVGSGELDKDTARALIQISFPAVSSEQVDALLRSADGPAAKSPTRPTQARGGPQAGQKGGRGLLDPLKAPEEGNAAALAAADDNGTAAEPDFIEATALEAIDDWEPLMEPMMAPIDDLINDCSDLSQLQARLAEALGSMDAGAFAGLLARGGFAARVAGLARPDKRDG